MTFRTGTSRVFFFFFCFGQRDFSWSMYCVSVQFSGLTQQQSVRTSVETAVLRE